MYSKSRLLNLNIPGLRQTITFSIELSKVLEVANFRFLAKFRFLTLEGEKVANCQ